MARKDKILDILALASLPESAQIARLANRWIGKPLSRAQAVAVVDCYLSVNGRKRAVVEALMAEKRRQEGLRNGRQAFTTAAAGRAKSPLDKYRESPSLRTKRTMDIIQRTFGQHVRDNFNETTLSLMSLIAGESQSYTVRWVEAGFQPVRSALIAVVVTGGNRRQERRYLLYKVNNRVLVANTHLGCVSLRDAWASQLPSSFLVQLPELQREGCSFESDLEGQQMVITGPEGLVDKVEWTGRTIYD